MNRKRLGLYQLLALTGVNAAIIVYFWAQVSGQQLLTGGLANVLIPIGRLCGLLATMLVLGQLTMISRVRWLERKIGFDGVTHYHYLNGRTLVYLIVAHPILLSLGYAALAGTDPITQFLLLLQWPYVWLALIAWLMIVTLVAFAAIGALRRRLSYEQWYWTHTSMYLAIALVFLHQITNGADLGDPLFRLYWEALYVIAFGLIIIYRFGIPLWRNWRHRFVVERVERITPSAVSIWVGGRGLDKFHYHGGQFNIWYFLDGKRWWQKHPFTISIEPGRGKLRISAKDVGGFTHELDKVKVGTRVFVDGPYGVFTPELSSGKKVLLIAGGSGITPLRAMLPQLITEGRDVILLYGNQMLAETMLRDEIEELAKAPNFSWHNVLSDDPKGKGEHGQIDAAKITRHVPDVSEREVYLCGPAGMMDALKTTLQEFGVARERIHTELFRL